MQSENCHRFSDVLYKFIIFSTWRSTQAVSYTHLPKEEPKKQTVTVSIRGSKSVGTILEATEAAWNEGDTAFSVLKNITRAQGIPMEFSGSGASVYVEGIANLYEFDEGATSGWVYRVNGTLVSKSAGACVLHPGDRIEWIYTLNLGKDLN